MTDKIVEVPGLGNVSFPDSMSDVDIDSAIKKQLFQQKIETMRANINKPVNLPETTLVDIANDNPTSLVGRLAAGGEVVNSMEAGIKRGAKFIPDAFNELNDIVHGRVAPSGNNPLTSLARTPEIVAKSLKNLNPLPADQGQGLINRMAEGLGVGVGAGITSKAVGDVAALRRKTPPPPATTVDVAKVVTDTVNPPAKNMEAFQSAVSKNLPEVVQQAGKPIVTRLQLGETFEKVANTKRQTYNEQFIKPIANEVVYQNGKEATIGQMEARLHEINSTLRPAYEKGGATAQATITAEAKSAMNAEAKNLRNTLNIEIGKRLKVAPEVVAEARQSYGEMYGIADKIKLAVQQERHALNKARSEPYSLHTTAAGVAAQLVEKGWSALRGRPADRALKNAMENYKPDVATTPQPSPFSPQPITGIGVPKQAKPPIAVEGSTAEQIADFQARLASGQTSRAAARAAEQARRDAAKSLAEGRQTVRELRKKVNER